MSPAPIALFAFRRPEHTRRAIEALRANALARNSALYVFSDGPRDARDEASVAAVRAVAREVAGFARVEVTEQLANRGLARSIIAGVTRLCTEHGRVIVVEDDLVVSPRFLDYMNGALERYAADERVMQVSGYMFPLEIDSPDDALFLPLTTSWGWATWARAWRHFDEQARDFPRLRADAASRRRFNLDDAYDYYGMLCRQQAGEVDSWAIRWYLNVFFREGLVLYPRRTLVANEGFDSTGTHGPAHERLRGAPEDGFRVARYPVPAPDARALDQIKRNFRKAAPAWTARVRNWIHARTRAAKVPH